MTRTLRRNCSRLDERDVHMAADGALVVIHDPALARTTNGRGLVGAHTLADLRRLDAGAWFGPAFAGTAAGS